MGVYTNSKAFSDVIEKVRGKHFQVFFLYFLLKFLIKSKIKVACKYVYQILHPIRTGNMENEFDGQHPNSYFESSLNYHQKSEEVLNNKIK